MESIFNKGPTARAVTVYDQIGPEISHLRKRGSVRESSTAGSKAGAWAASVALFLLLVLFFMDPFLFALHKSSAIRAYTYLHAYDSDSSTKALVATGIFTPHEILAMNNRHGSYLDYYTSPTQAGQAADSTVNFMNGLHNLRYGDYTTLDPISQLRYMLFIRMGLYPPTFWSCLNPSVD